MKVFITLLLIVLLFVTACNFTGGAIINPSDEDPSGECSSLEGAARDNCYFESLKCSKIQNENFRDSCVAELAKEKKFFPLQNSVRIFLMFIGKITVIRFLE